MGINIAVHKRVVTKLTRKFCLTIWFYRNRSSQLDNVSTEFFVLQRSQSPQRKNYLIQLCELCVLCVLALEGNF